jgi:hypothetical protein
LIKTYSKIDPTVLDTHQQRKHRRIIAIERMIKERGMVNYNEFLAELQYYGIRKKVAEEYIDVLKDLRKIRFEKDFIYWVD